MGHPSAFDKKYTYNPVNPSFKSVVMSNLLSQN